MDNLSAPFSTPAQAPVPTADAPAGSLSFQEPTPPRKRPRKRRRPVHSELVEDTPTVHVPAVMEDVEPTDADIVSRVIQRWFIDVRDGVLHDYLVRVVVTEDGGRTLRFYDAERGVWFADTSGVTVMRRLREFAETISVFRDSLVVLDGDLNAVDQANLHAANKLLMRLGSNAALRSMAAMLPVLLPETTEVTGEAFDRKKDLLCVRNGVLDLRTGELQPHDSRHLFTKRLDVNYDPVLDPPEMFLAFLRDIFPENTDETIGWLQQVVGQALTGYVGETMCIFVGNGANGKSTLLEILSAILGGSDDHRSGLVAEVPLSAFEGGRGSDNAANAIIASMAGSRMVVANEGSGSRLNEAVVKRIVSNDRLTGRFLGGQPFSFRPTFTTFVATNHRPIVMGQDDGIWRRISLLWFKRAFAPAEQDTTLAKNIIDAEAPEILAWALDGARRWFEQGMKIETPAFMIESVEVYRSESDEMGDFLGSVLFEDAEAKVALSDVFEAWCSFNNEPVGNQKGLRQFGQMLRERIGHDRVREARVGNRAKVAAVIGYRLAAEDAPALGHGIFDAGS